MTTDESYVGSLETVATGMNAQIAASAGASERFLEDTIQHPEKRLLQTAAVADGALIGALKAVPDRLINHTQATFETAAQGAIITGAFTAFAKMRSPAMRTGLCVTGLGLAGNYVYDLGSRLSANQELTQALDAIWKGGDVATVCRSASTLEHHLGSESFDFALASLAGVGTAHAFGRFDGWLKPLSSDTRFCPIGLPSQELSGPLLAGTLSLDEFIVARSQNGKVKRYFVTPYQQASAIEPVVRSNGEIFMDSEKHIPLSAELDKIMSLLLKGDKTGAEKALSKTQKMNDSQRGIKNDASSPSEAAQHGFVHEQLLTAARFLRSNHLHLTPEQVMTQTRDMLFRLQGTIID